MYTFKTTGTCSTEIKLSVEGDVVRHCEFSHGCNGNLQGLARLVTGRPVDEVIELLSGIECRNGTSCPDQLAKALVSMKEQS